MTAQEIGFGQVLWMILMLAVILLATYFVTKWIAARTMTKGVVLGGKIKGTNGCAVVPKVIFRNMLDRENSILVIEYDGVDYLVGVGAGSFTVLEKRDIPREEAEERGNQQKAQVAHPFAQYMDKWKHNQQTKGEDKP